MSWTQDVEREMAWAREAQKAGNHGKARTCARRAIGIAAGELQRTQIGFSLGNDFMTQVRTIAEDGRFSEETRKAAGRLGARISGDFTSPSADPVQDAVVVLSDLTGRIASYQARSSER